MSFEDTWHDEPLGPDHKMSVFQTAYAHMLRDIRSGYFKPGEKLKIRALVARYGISTGACREVLIRLTSERFVESQSMSGFRVRELSAQEFITAVEMRNELEIGALADSLAKGDEAWEERLVVAFHRVRRARLASEDDLENRETAHRQFHSALVAGSLSVWKRSTVHLLNLHIERYRRIVRPSSLLTPEYVEKVDAEHERLKDLALSRDVDKTVELLRAHRGRSLDDIRARLQ